MSKFDFNPYSLRNLRSKSKKEADGGYTATLLHHGEPVAHINCGTDPTNDDLEIGFFYREEEEAFKQHTARAVPDGMDDDEMGKDEVFLREMAEAVYQAGRRDYFARESTLYRIDDDPAGVWRQAKYPFRPALALALASQHPGRQVTFANAVRAG